MNNLPADAIDAHGGYKRWKELATLACDVNAFGELHRLKKSPPQSGPIHFIAKTTEQVCSITLPPEPGETSFAISGQFQPSNHPIAGRGATC